MTYSCLVKFYKSFYKILFGKIIYEKVELSQEYRTFFYVKNK